MTVVPAGDFLMGSPEDEEGRYANEGPQHRVTIAKPFAVGVYPVTFTEWGVCVGCRHRPSDQRWGRGQQPISNVSWDDAQSYVHWLSEHTGQPYRLLSEAEWEYVARAGKYHRQTTPVGTFDPNAFGLHGVHGNVWEWVQDCWHDSYEGAPGDGSTWGSEYCQRRVLRGGSWDNNLGPLRSANRDWYTASDRSTIIGFRIARSVD